MPAPDSQPSVLLLERTESDTEPRPGPRVLPPRPDHSTSVGATSSVPLLRGPGLAVLAAVSVLEGYRWFGVIANGGARPWALVFAAVAVIGGYVLTRNVGGRPRTTVQRMVVSAVIFVTLATGAVLASDQGWATVTIGIADLTLATTALAALVAGERSGRGHVAA